MAKAEKDGADVRIRRPKEGAEVVAKAADGLAAGLGAILGRSVPIEDAPELGGNRITVEAGASSSGDANPSTKLVGDAFEIARPAPATIAIRGASDRALIHAMVNLLERLGASYPPGVPPRFPRIERERLFALDAYTVTPAFSRRAFASDILTWNYGSPDCLEMHLGFDREFIPWMGRRGINRFEYIRHARDERLRIDELAALYSAYGIGSEYGGHVLQFLMPRERFESNPEYFPMDAKGTRNPRGNLCVSNPEAVRLVVEGALSYVREYPENRFLHIWGADVLKGAWCGCSECKELSPQLQYMKVVNAIAAALKKVKVSDLLPVAYLAYHDTIEPDPGLRPLDNVSFEWAPRERCYVHAIDERACRVNARYHESLKRCVDLFEGRGHVFEYYADAMLFGGLGFATPSVIARDLRAYRALGIDSISCLTFGAHSVLAYPVNLEAFVRATRDPDDLDAATVVRETAAGRHPGCAETMEKAYRAIERVSMLMLDYGDLMKPYTMTGRRLASKRDALPDALAEAGAAVDLAQSVKGKTRTRLLKAEETLWTCGMEVLSAIGDYLRAREERGIVRRTLGEAAVARMGEAIEHIREIPTDIGDTWGAYDLEWIRESWLDALRRNLAEGKKFSEDA